MQQYKKVSTDMDFVSREEEILAFWKENQIFEKSVKQNAGKPAYTFYDGPPTANGKPHIGHILTRCIKDIIPRHRSMKGYDVLRKAGWDTHGLPVELEVEKSLGLDGKEQIEQYGVEPFIAKCKQSVWKYQGEWERMSERVGFWVDMDDPYVTYENDYIESVWWSLKRIADKGLLYKGHKIVPYCPRCGTALSSHEVAQGYKDVKETSLIAKFLCTDSDPLFADTAFLAWTTTPWTLPSNVALCVNPTQTYCKASIDGANYILAKALVQDVLGEDAVIQQEFTGKSLEGKTYQPLFDFAAQCVEPNTKAWYITCDSFVTLTDGTGIVHMAPAFGEDDALVGKRYDLPFVQLVAPNGLLCGGTYWDGVFVKDADKLIIEHLRESGKLFKTLDYEHSYPFCWRCNTPLIYYARKSWFIQMTAVKEKLAAFNRSVNWLPENIKEGRMGNFIDNVIDWGISRERYWGTPLPVWVCADCGEVHVVGSIAQLKEMGKNVPDDIELHKPFIDEVHLNCPKCKGDMARVPEVIDCWYDSGSMPFAQWHYPFENKEEFERRFPANFISEAIDQTRGWFYTLLAISALIFDEACFQNCVVLGHVQDAEGRKMSKHIGNVVDPWTVLDVQGADAVRWYFFTNSQPWLPSRFGANNVSESQRKFMGTLWNTYAFYVLYADIDGFDPCAFTLDREALAQMDRWVLSRLHSTVAFVDEMLDGLHITEAGRALQDFVDDLSNWYVRRSRERFWGSAMTADKQAAFMTLYTVLETLCKLCAPFVPFMSEAMYQNIVRPFAADAKESVHLCTFPCADATLIDRDMEQQMQKVRDIVVLARACRNASAIKNRQPISTMYVVGSEVSPAYACIIAEELNVKEVLFAKDATAYTTYEIKPQLRTMGPKYGKMIGKIGAYLKGVDGNEVVQAFNEAKAYTFELEGTQIVMQADDALCELTQKPGYVAQADKGLTVVLNTNLTPDLLEEGLVREVISKVQAMRKEAGFVVTDHIVLSHEGNDTIAQLMLKHEAQIRKEVLAERIQETACGYIKQWDINACEVTLGVQKV